jgi:hypothetical protein
MKNVSVMNTLLAALLLAPLAVLHAAGSSGNATIRGAAGFSEIVITTTARLAGAIHSLTAGRSRTKSTRRCHVRSRSQGPSHIAGNEKPPRLNTQEVLNRVGLLVNGPPGAGGVPFV